MTRKRSMAKSLRASIRRLRKRRQPAGGSPKKEKAEGAAGGSGEAVPTTDIDADKVNIDTQDCWNKMKSILR